MLVRSADKAKKLESFGLKAVVGSLQDLDGVESLASQADVVISCADADDLPAITAIVNGMKKRHCASGFAAILIHTSGTGKLYCSQEWEIYSNTEIMQGVLTDHAIGMFASDTIYYDTDPDQIETLAPTQVHRNVDLMIVDADAKGYLKSYIVLPSTIFGIATGPLVDVGLINPYSVQIPQLIKVGLARGQAGMIGEGKNIWPNVHIDEIADLYQVIFDNVSEGRPIGHGREGFYFGENDQYVLSDIVNAVGVALRDAGKSETAEPSSFNDEELDKFFGGPGNLNPQNSRCRAERSRAIGWKPVKKTADLIASIKPELEAILETGQY